MRRSRGILSLLREREGSSGPPPDNCHHLTISSAYGHTSAAIWDTSFKLSPSLPIKGCFPPWEILHKPSTSEKQTEKRAFVSIFIQTYLFENRASTTLEPLTFTAWKPSALNRELLLKPHCCSPHSSYAGHAPSWGGLVLASSRWVLRASWPTLASSVHENGWPIVSCWFSAFISSSVSLKLTSVHFSTLSGAFRTPVLSL